MALSEREFHKLRASKQTFLLYFSEIWVIITNSHRSTIQRLSSWLVLVGIRRPVSSILQLFIQLKTIHKKLHQLKAISAFKNPLSTSQYIRYVIFAFCHVRTPSRLFSSLTLWYEKAVVLHPAALHLPPHRVDNDPEVAAEDDPAQVAHDQVELVRAHLEVGAVEGLGHVRDQDEDVEGEAEAVPDQPEYEEDPGRGSDPVDEQTAGGHPNDGETHPSAPGNGAHHWRCLSFYLWCKTSLRM